MPRTGPVISDERVFAAIVEVISEVGPAELTLARIGEGAGLTAGALVQRFGSKQGLLAAFAARSVENVRALFLASANRHPGDPWGAAVDGLVRLSLDVQDRRAFANHLAWFALELADDDLRPMATAHHRSVQAELAALLGSAAAARQLRAFHQGALLLWAVEGRGGLEAYLRRDLGRAAAALRDRSEV
jgi:AcrR family transcriptional regulator